MAEQPRPYPRHPDGLTGHGALVRATACHSAMVRDVHTRNEVVELLNYDRLFERHYGALFRYLHRLTGDADAAEDAVQEAFVRLTEHTLPEDEVRPWLFTVATNLVRDSARKADRHRRLQTHVPVARGPLPPDVSAARTERIAMVRRALDELPERDRRMLLMREEGFRYSEIAAAVGVAPASVGTLLARAAGRFADTYTALGAEKTLHDAS